MGAGASGVTAAGPVVLYDGACGLCSRWVRFLIKRDAAGTIRFASLQSDVGRSMLAAAGLPEDLVTVVLIEHGEAATRSTAALRACRYLRTPARWLSWLLLIPRPLRDVGYRIVAATRYRWFGRDDVCALATPEELARFLDR